MRPTPSASAAVDASCGTLRDALARYRQVVDQDLAAVNAALTSARLAPVPPPSSVVGPGCAVPGR